MTTTFRFLIALMGCLHLCGGHYGVLQGIAWTQMLIGYSAEEGWLEGAKQTFDGQHPCGLCEAIADAKQQDSDPSGPSPHRRGLDSGLELKPCPVTRPLVITAPDSLLFLPSHPDGSSIMMGRLPSGPEPPPPRVV